MNQVCSQQPAGHDCEQTSSKHCVTGRSLVIILIFDQDPHHYFEFAGLNSIDTLFHHSSHRCGLEDLILTYLSCFSRIEKIKV